MGNFVFPFMVEKNPMEISRISQRYHPHSKESPKSRQMMSSSVSTSQYIRGRQQGAVRDAEDKPLTQRPYLVFSNTTVLLHPTRSYKSKVQTKLHYTYTGEHSDLYIITIPIITFIIVL